MCSGSTTCCAITSPLRVHEGAGGVLRLAHDGGEAGAEQRVLHLLHDAGEARLDHFEVNWVDGRSRSPHRSVMRHPVRFRFIRLRLPLRRVTMTFFHSSTRATWPGQIDGGAVELIEDRGSLDAQPDVEPLALIDRAIERRAIETHAPRRAPRIGEARPGRPEFRQLHRRHKTDPAHAVGDDLDRLLAARCGRTSACGCRRTSRRSCCKVAGRDRRRAAGHRDLVALSGVAHVERALDADLIGAQSLGAADRLAPALRARRTCRSTSCGLELRAAASAASGCSRASRPT